MINDAAHFNERFAAKFKFIRRILFVEWILNFRIANLTKSSSAKAFIVITDHQSGLISIDCSFWQGSQAAPIRIIIGHHYPPQIN